MIKVENEVFVFDGMVDTLPYKFYENCKVISEGNSDATGELVTEIAPKSGVYKLEHNGKVSTYFHYEDYCKVLECYDKSLYYYLVALQLTPSCPIQYGKLCDLYKEFDRIVKTHCDDCL